MLDKVVIFKCIKINGEREYVSRSISNKEFKKILKEKILYTLLNKILRRNIFPRKKKDLIDQFQLKYQKLFQHLSVLHTKYNVLDKIQESSDQHINTLNENVIINQVDDVSKKEFIKVVPLPFKSEKDLKGDIKSGDEILDQEQIEPKKEDQIFIKGFGKLISLKYNPMITIFEIKKHIFERKNTPIIEQYLSYNG